MRRGPSDSNSGSTHVARVRALSRVLDDAVRVPGTKLRFGLDGIIGLLPGAGDLLGSAFGLYALAAAGLAGAPRSVIVRMAANLAADAVVGAVPLLGDVFDFAFKAHRRNARLLEGWAAAPERTERASRLTVVAVVAGVTVVLLGALVLGGWLLASAVGLLVP